MATIQTIESNDRYEPESRDKINANFSALNTESAGKLDKAGGTMTGNINMNNNRVTNLPAPSAGSEPARKADLDAYTPPDNSITAQKISHDNTRTKFSIIVGFESAGAGLGAFMKVGSYRFAGGGGIFPGRAGCITAVTLTDGSGTLQQKTAAYNISGTNHFTAGQHVSIDYPNDTTEVPVNVRISGGVVAPLSWSGSIVQPRCAIIEIEFDN